MASRFSFPTAYDPQMHREEVLTLARTNSRYNALTKLNSGSQYNPNSPPTPMNNSSSPSAAKESPQSVHLENFVFADPVAFRFIEDDPATVLVQRHGRLQGYELYMVEQWVCSRANPTFVIATYTGDPDHSISVGVLEVPKNRDEWSPRLRHYFKAASKYQARAKETELGSLMITNLSNFPSALTVIPVPEGNVGKHREDFIVNEDLKRLNCSGRSGMSLSAPAGATKAKFLQLYKTSERVNLAVAVIELVKLCQIALIVFGKLEEEYLDGLLCDMTEKAISDWWTDIGSELYNTEPSDGVLGPTTVSALLGTLMGARNRLDYLNASPPKDAFEYHSLQRSVSYFQKNQDLARTKKLDRHTLNRLHNTTAKAAAGEGWAVPKAIKSTVAELSGKGGEMIMGMVGRDKAGMGEIETLEIDRFVTLVHGERAKCLWLGKPRRSGHAAVDAKAETDLASLRAEKIPPEENTNNRRREKDSPHEIYSAQAPGSAVSMLDTPIEKDYRKSVMKSVTGKMNDASNRIGRIKDVVGIRGHASKHSRDEGPESEVKGISYLNSNNSTTTAISTVAPQSPQPGIGKAFSWKETPSDYQNGRPKNKDVMDSTASSILSGVEPPISDSNFTPPVDSVRQEIVQAELEAKWRAQVKDIRETLVVTDPSVGGSAYGDGDLQGPVLEADRDPGNFEVLLHRRHSMSGPAPYSLAQRHKAWWPRQMSFTDAEDAILGWEPIDGDNEELEESDPWAALQRQIYTSENLKKLFEDVLVLRDSIGPWVESVVSNVDDLDEQAGQDQEAFQNLFYRLTETYQMMKSDSEDTLGNERAHVMEMIKDVEVLGAKLEYEINALVSKVQDVEEGVAQFEREVDSLEFRTEQLEKHLSTETWAHWLVRSITGIGTPPNRPSSVASVKTVNENGASTKNVTVDGTNKNNS